MAVTGWECADILGAQGSALMLTASDNSTFSQLMAEAAGASVLSSSRYVGVPRYLSHLCHLWCMVHIIL